MSVERRTNPGDLQVLFREVHRLSASLKNLDFSLGENPLLLPARGVLQLLREGGSQTVPTLARAQTTSRQNIQIIVDRLERLGCVAIKQNPKHKRSSLVELTGKGRSVLAEVEAQESDLLQLLAARFSAEETLRALDCVRRVSAALGQTREAGTARPTGLAKPLTGEVRRVKRQIRPGSTEPIGEVESEEGLPVSLL